MAAGWSAIICCVTWARWSSITDGEEREDEILHDIDIVRYHITLAAGGIAVRVGIGTLAGVALAVDTKEQYNGFCGKQ